MDLSSDSKVRLLATAVRGMAYSEARAYLTEQCGDDEGLYRRVMQLVESGGETAAAAWPLSVESSSSRQEWMQAGELIWAAFPDYPHGGTGRHG